jgi:lycopene beta-cyclase
VLVGGGLQNALIALALRARRPETRLALIERGATLGGNHLWSFHVDDVPADLSPCLEPLVVARWQGYEVAFPGLRRTLTAPYASVSAPRLHEVVSASITQHPGSRLLTGVAVAGVDSRQVVLENGQRLQARAVIDARGPEPTRLRGPMAWQKFLGLELALRTPAPFTRPWLMDALVPQTGGFRFFYLLPLAPDRVLVEDTYFAEQPTLDLPALRTEVLRYAAAHGLQVERVEREETGVLPLPLAPLPPPALTGPLVAGMRGGWYHPTTGYSFSAAARLARHIASTEPEQLFGPAFRTLAQGHARQARFAVLLNRLLFRATAAADRHAVFARFYRLPEETIRRFYALQTTAADRARILCGRPPRGVSLRAALSQLVAT